MGGIGAGLDGQIAADFPADASACIDVGTRQRCVAGDIEVGDTARGDARVLVAYVIGAGRIAYDIDTAAEGVARALATGIGAGLAAADRYRAAVVRAARHHGALRRLHVQVAAHVQVGAAGRHLSALKVGVAARVDGERAAGGNRAALARDRCRVTALLLVIHRRIAGAVLRHAAAGANIQSETGAAAVGGALGNAGALERLKVDIALGAERGVADCGNGGALQAEVFSGPQINVATGCKGDRDAGAGVGSRTARRGRGADIATSAAKVGADADRNRGAATLRVFHGGRRICRLIQVDVAAGDHADVTAGGDRSALQRGVATGVHVDVAAGFQAADHRMGSLRARLRGRARCRSG